MVKRRYGAGQAHAQLNAVQVYAETRPSNERRIGEMIEPQPDGCWIYKGDPERYGSVSGKDMRTTSAHRFVYKTLRGPIPKGHHLHHTCERPGCVNPDHLVVLTPKEHGEAHAALRKRKAS